MMTLLMTTWRIVRACLLLFAIALPAWAHDPFDGNIQMIVLGDRIEAKLTLGYDAARAFFRASGLPPVEAARMTRPGGRQRLPLPPALADKLLTLQIGARPVPPSAVLVAPSDVEIELFLVFPRQAGATLRARAAYFDVVKDMRPGLLVVADKDRRLLASAMLTNEAPDAEVPLDLAATRATARTTARAAAHPAGAGFGRFVRMGVEHILTGYDHLLFLCALLLSMRRVRSMLGIVTAFTLSHSVTLALAAFDIVLIPSSIVEPLIAASIIAACVANLVRREQALDRYWMAACFGLIHGFGFAGALREATLAQTGAALLLPLAGFNLGVEAGQLLVAALLIPLLLLARRQATIARYALPALSTAIILVSSYWLLERLHMA
jgi:hydrogenase/urease accessory protein HupE